MADFSRLPALIKEKVAEKMKFDDLISFGGCSTEANSVVSKARFSVPDHITEVHFEYFHKEVHITFGLESSDCHEASKMPSIQFVDKTINISGDINASYCSQLIAFFQKTGAKNSKLKVLYDWRCSVDAFNDLLKAADVTELCSFDIPPSFLQNLPETVSNIFVKSRVKDEDLRKIKAEDIVIDDCHIGNDGLNNLLKEWMRGERTIKRILIRSKERLNPHILDGIDHEFAGNEFLFTLNNGKQLLYLVVYGNGVFNAASEKEKLRYLKR